MDKNRLIEIGRRTVAIEERAIANLHKSIDANFAAACNAILKCESGKGRTVVIGLGKSGHIARKISATLSSTGTPSFFVHSAEAGHGDLGMITRQDIVIMISYSGNSEELVRLIPLIKRLNVPMISITGNKSSPLAVAADISLLVKVEEEACPLGLAPTSSTTATLVIGDALAIALLEARGFTADDFAFSHPSGLLGRRLLLKVGDIMHKGKDIPMVSAEVKITEALLEVSSKMLGMTNILDKDKKLIGVFTDGDLRRCLDKKIDIHTASVSEVMTKKFTSVQDSDLAAAALKIMDDKKINALPVLNREGKLVGAMNMHDLLKAGVI